MKKYNPVPCDYLDIYDYYGDGYKAICDVTDFLRYMPKSKLKSVAEVEPCQELPGTPDRGLDTLQVFWHPTETDQSYTQATLPAGAVNAQVLPVHEKIKSLLLALKHEDAENTFIQYWTPIKYNRGRMMLSVIGQPFGMGSLYNGFCKYRYMSMQQVNLLENGSIGPVGRVYSRGTPEHCASIKSYSTEEFPMKYDAIFCGSYLALPVYDCLQHQACTGPVGVLEILSLESRSPLYQVVSRQLKDLGLICTHKGRLADIDEDDGGFLKSTLLSLTKKHKLPLVQLWIPILCNQTKKFTRLMCNWTSSPDMFFGNASLDIARGNYSVDVGKGIIGRAWSQNKTCFLGKMSQLGISDYPLVHVLRSSCLTSCFAIPLQSFSPCLVLEVFFPAEDDCDPDYVGVVLKSLLAAMADIPYRISENTEFCVHYSHSDEEKFLYFDIYPKTRTMSNGKTLGNDSQGHQSQPSQKKDDGQNSGARFAPLICVGSSRESSKNGEAESLDDDRVEDHDILGSNTREIEICPAEKVKGTLPSHKRKEAIQFVEAGDNFIQEPEIGSFPNKRAKENNEAADSNGKSTAPGNDETNRGFRIIVEASYDGDLAKFFLWSNSGIEDVHKELHKRFNLEADKFQIKYKDDAGRLVILSCDEDLLFHLETSKTPGQIFLELSLLPATL